jgi:hypothetical protein
VVQVYRGLRAHRYAGACWELVSDLDDDYCCHPWQPLGAGAIRGAWGRKRSSHCPALPRALHAQ